MTETPKITEGRIQIGLWHMLCSGSAIVVPNTTLYGWESDLLRVTNALYVYELEIKLTRSDFLRDHRKDRHHHLTGKGFKYPPYRIRRGPNYFTYVLPEGRVEPDEVPEWSGLMWWKPAAYNNGSGVTFETVRKPKKRHGTKISDNSLRRLERGMTFRFWSSYQSLVTRPAQ
jgi:hypothetical protein